jgi:hypothetical protein
MAGDGLTAAQRWFTAHSDGAPAPLCERAGRYLTACGAAGLPADQLAAAARDALAAALVPATSGNRSAALDLLAADALMTLALLARAEDDPATLAGFAAALRREAAA